MESSGTSRSAHPEVASGPPKSTTGAMGGMGRLLPRGFKGGLTLVEFVVAMSITILIGAAASAMFFSISRGTTSRTDARRLNVRLQLIASRMDAAIRSSKMVMFRDPGTLVLWMGYTRENDEPDISEIRRIELTTATAQLMS